MSVFKGGHSTAPREHGTRLDIYPWVRMATKMADRWVQMYSIAIQTQYVYCTFEGKTEPVGVSVNARPDPGSRVVHLRTPPFEMHHMYTV